MKILGGLIVGCLVIIAFNLVAALVGSANGNYDSGHAERVAQFVIILIPLSVIFGVVGLLKLVIRQVKKG